MVKVGQHWVEFIRNTHSMADASRWPSAPVDTVIFTGDAKFDHTPVDGEHFDLARLAHHGDKVLCLFSDSTNAEVPASSARCSPTSIALAEPKDELPPSPARFTGCR